MSFLKQEVTMPKFSVPKLSFGKPARRSSHPRRSGGGRPTAVTGLEISATQLIAAQAEIAGGQIVAQRVVSHPIAPNIVRDGVVLDAQALTAALRECFKEHKLGRRVRIGLATPRTVLRVIDLPPLAEEDVAAALLVQAQDRIPMPLDRAVLDHQTVGLVDTPDGQRLQVIVVATERAAVDVLLDATRAAGLRAEGIDLSVFAAIRAVSGAEPPRGPLLYVQLGDLVNLAIAESGVCRFTRQAPQGLAFVLQRLAELRECTAAEAYALVLSAAGPYETADPDDVRAVGALLGQVATELGSELRATAEFYGTQSGLTVSEGIVTGALAPLRGFVPALAAASGLELTCGEVHTEAGVHLDVDPRVAPVAVGLCAGSVGR